MSCPSETRLQAFVDGELDTEAITTLSKHLDTCDDCRMLVGAVQPVALDDETIVERVGRYVLRRVLGRGGMGVVYEAVDPELHRDVALKVLRSDLRQDRLLAEAEAMAKLQHPNVVPIYDVGRDADRVFIVMALIDGVSLRQWLIQPRTVDEIVDAFLQAGKGLHAAHEAGLVHRDVKPENIFVARDGRVLVGDFGLATSEEEARAGEGTVRYMAPEQKIDARSDQYSFAVSLDEALPQRPRWLARVIARGKERDPAKRFATLDALLAAIRTGRKRAAQGRVLGATFVGLIVFGAIGIVARPTRDLALCKTGTSQVDAAWQPRTIEAAFFATKSTLAGGTWKKTSQVTGEYVQSWKEAVDRTCKAREPIADQKLACLSDRLEILRAVNSSLEHVDGPMLEQVPSMLALLPRVSACEDVREVASRPPLPPPDKTAAVEAVKRQVAEANALVAAGKYEDALARAAAASEAAKQTGYLPVGAEASLVLGLAQGRLGHPQEAERALEQAVSSSSAAHAPAISVRAWIQLIHFIGFEAKRWEDGARYAEYAKTALESIPGAWELEIERLTWLRAMLLDQKRYNEALVVSREELTLVEKQLGKEHHLSAVANDGLAGVLAGQCKARDAIPPQTQSCSILEAEYGASHPQVALCLGNLAALYSNLGEHDRAIAIKERALGMFEQVAGHPNHVAMAHRNRARSLIELGRFEEARQELDAASAASKRESDETSVILLRGTIDRRDGKDGTKSGRLALERSTTPSRKLDALVELAESELAVGHAAEAARLAEEAVGIARTLHGAGACRTAEPLRVQADALRANGKDSLAVAESALRALQPDDVQVDPLARARAEVAVGLALPRHDGRARELLTRARSVASSRDPKLTERIDAAL